MRLKQVNNIVKEVLEQSLEARKDNFVLVADVYEKIGISKNITLDNLTNNHRELQLPSFESICRARRKLIEQFPELNGIEEKRQEMEQEYIEFVRER